MAKKVNAIPEGYHSITPNLVIRGAAEAIEYYKKAFGAELTFRMDTPDGKVMHATIRIGDSILMLADECAPHEKHKEECVRSPADLKGTTTNLFLYVKDVDGVFDRAIKAGGKAAMAVEDMFWGDRVGMLSDPFGHFWTVATHVQDVGGVELEKRTKEFLNRQNQQVAR